MAILKSLNVPVPAAGTRVALSATRLLCQSVLLFVPTGDLCTVGDITVVHSAALALPVNVMVGPFNATDPLNPIDLANIFVDAAANDDRVVVFFVEA